MRLTEEEARGALYALGAHDPVVTYRDYGRFLHAMTYRDESGERVYFATQRELQIRCQPSRAELRDVAEALTAWHNPADERTA